MEHTRISMTFKDYCLQVLIAHFATFTTYNQSINVVCNLCIHSLTKQNNQLHVPEGGTFDNCFFVLALIME